MNPSDLVRILSDSQEKQPKYSLPFNFGCNFECFNLHRNSTVRIVEINRLDEISQFESEWTRILSTKEKSNVNYSFEWTYLLYKHMGDESKNRLYVIEDGNKILGFIPLIKHVSKGKMLFPIRQLSFIGEKAGINDFCDFIIEENEKSLIECFFSHLKQNKSKWDSLHLKYLTEACSNLDAIQDALTKFSIEYAQAICTRVLYIDLNSYENSDLYFKSLSRNMRRELRKRINKLNAYKTYRYERNSSVPSRSLLDIIRRLNTKRQRQIGRESCFENHAFLGFLEEMIHTFRANGTLEFSLIYIEDKPVSYTLGFKYHNIYYHWSIGFDSDYSHVSPNKVHHKLLIEDLFKDKISEFNFMRGDSEYKFKWTKTYRNSYRMRILNKDSCYGRFLGRLERIAGRGLLG